ncbi:hypothetical protein HZB94_01155 [Candidatus Falkowbacteria bacterium]|nr:hypothetical protein [Candidatus Falkowbacteria bacterium]
MRLTFFLYFDIICLPFWAKWRFFVKLLNNKKGANMATVPSQGRFCEKRTNGRKCGALMHERATLWQCNTCGNIISKSSDEITRSLMLLRRDDENYHARGTSRNQYDVERPDLYPCAIALP